MATDVNKVIKGLEWILADDKFGFGVNWETGEPRDEYEKAGKIITDVIALLKEQEAVALKPHYIDKYGKNFICGVECGNCGVEISATYKFCPYCGRSVKWDGRY